MPKLSVWMVRASFLCMGLGYLFGALILHHKGIPLFDWTWRLLNPHIELMIFGWMMQFAIGIAFWILPRFSKGPRYGRVDIGWWGFGLFNGGVLMTVAGTWFADSLLALIGRCIIVLAVVLFTVVLWPRVKPLSQVTASHSSSR